MSTPDKQLWQGLAPEARTALVLRDYGRQTFSEQLAGAGIEAGKLALESHPFSLRKLLRDLERLFAKEIREKDITFFNA